MSAGIFCRYDLFTVYCSTVASCKLGDTFPSIESSKTASNFTTNAWGYLPNYYNATGTTPAVNTTTYYPAPTTTGTTLRVTGEANSTAHDYTISLGLKADYTNASGTYENNAFILEYVANPVAYSISFADDTGDNTVASLPSALVSEGTTATSIRITNNSTPTRTGYTFKSWCLGSTSNSGTTCTGEELNVGDDFGIDQTISNANITLNAVWNLNTYNVAVNFVGTGVTGVTFTNNTYGDISVTTSGNIAALKHGVSYQIVGSYSNGYAFSSWSATAGSLGSTSSAATTYSTTAPATLTLTGQRLLSMQEFSAADCAKLAVGSTLDLSDARDNNIYKIGKLADNKCWMLDNLRLDLVATSLSALQGNTNASNTDLNYLKNGGGGGNSSNMNAASGVSYWHVNSVTEPQINIDYKDDFVTSYGLGSGKAGVYYNPCAFSAGTRCSDYAEEVKSDICPSGWRLPTAGYGTGYDSGELLNAYNNNVQATDPNSVQYAFSATLSGKLTGVPASNGRLGESGYFAGPNREDIYDLRGIRATANEFNELGYIETDLVYSSDITGVPVRCLKDIPTMQDTATVAASVPNIGDVATVKDARDGTKYLVERLVDGNIWMLENLALDLTNSKVKTAMLNSSDTKTNASYTSLNKLFNGGGTTSDKYPTAKLNNVAWTSSSQNYYSIPMMVKSGTCNNDYCVNSPSSGKWSYDAVTTATIDDITSRVQGKIGIYYNYCAASAGSYCYGSGTSAGTSVDNASSAIDSPEDICPAGWRMPTGGAIGTSGTSTGGGEYQYLYNQYSEASPDQITAFQTALSTPLSGGFNGGKAYDQGNSGSFWSSTRYISNIMYRLYVSSTNVYPQNYVNRYLGSSVRCIVDS